MAAGGKGVIVLSDEATSEVSVLMQVVLVKPRVTEQNSSKRRCWEGACGGGAKRNWVCGARMCYIRV